MQHRSFASSGSPSPFSRAAASPALASLAPLSPLPSAVPSSRRRLGPVLLGAVLALVPAVGFGAPPVAAPPGTATTAATATAPATAGAAAPATTSPHINPMLAARALYTRGAEHVERKDWKKAYVVLIEAWNIKRHWQIAMMLGWAEMELGKTRSAVEHLTMAAADKAPKDKPFPEKIKTLLADAKARLPSVRIQGAPPGARLAIDDVDVGTAPSTEPVAVDPGKHTITATLGAQRVSQEITVSERSPGHEEPVTASLQWPSASGKEAPGSSAKGLGPSIAPIVFGAGAVAGIVTGALLFAQAEAYHTSTDKALVAYRALPPSKWTAGNKKLVGDRLRAEDDLHTGALVSWLGAGVLAATGATLLVVLRRPSTKAPPKTSGGASSSAGAGGGARRRTAAETPGLEWAPIATPQGAGLLLQGRF